MKNTNNVWGELYLELVCKTAQEVSQMIELPAEAVALLEQVGADPDQVLLALQQDAYESVKDQLRQVFYQRVQEMDNKRN